MKKVLLFCLMVFMSFNLFASNGNSVKVLVLLSERYGPNYFLNRDAMDEYGWDITLTGLTEEVKPCPFFDNVFPITVDSLISDIKDIMAYDVLALMPVRWRSGTPYKEVLEDSTTMTLIKTAVDSGLVFWTSCAGVRVLAAADLLNGVDIIGTAKYQDEYAAAGANYLGEDHHPVIDGNIISCVRDQYYYLHNIDAIATVLEQNARNQNGSAVSGDLVNTLADIEDEDLIWAKTIGGSGSEGGKAIIQTQDGGFAIAGYTNSNSNGYTDLLVLKTDAEGNTEWSSTFGGTGWEYGYGIAETADGGYVVTGYTTSENMNKDVYLVKTDNTGNLVWEKTFGSDGLEVGYSVCVTTDDDILICGFTDADTNGEEDLYVIKTDDQGDLIWSQTYGEERSEIGQSIKQASDGSYMVIGATGSAFNTGNQDVWMLNLAENGDMNWNKTFGNTSDSFPFDWGKSASQMNTGEWIIAGNSNIVSPMQAYVVKTDSAGNQEWQLNYGDTFYDYGNSVCVNDDGSFLVAGATKVPGTLYNQLYLRYFDENANELWTKSLGGDNTEWANAVCSVQDGFVVLGHTRSMGAGKHDILLLKVSNIVQGMDVLPGTGHAPLEVEFEDHSYGYIESYEWDFDSDGTIDSHEKSPVFVFETPGEYSVSLTLQGGGITKNYQFENQVRVFNGESSLLFNTDSSYAKCQPTDELNLTQNLTLEAWVKPYNYGSYEFGRIVDKENFSLHLIGDIPGMNKNSVSFYLINSNNTISYTDSKENAVQLNEWQHFAVTYEAATSTAKMYINGVLQEADYLYGVPDGEVMFNGNFDLTIGNSIDHNLAFNGLIDEVRVWNVVRTDQEISTWMYDFVEKDAPGLIGYWHMNEGNGNELMDLSDLHNDAEIANVVWENGVDVLTGIEDTNPGDAMLPQTFELEQNYPNPFNPITTIRFALPKASYVKLDVYDIQGRLVKSLADVSQMQAGYYTAQWDGTNTVGTRVSTGVYFYRIQTRDFLESKKMVYIK